LAPLPALPTAKMVPLGELELVGGVHLPDGAVHRCSRVGDGRVDFTGGVGVRGVDRAGRSHVTDEGVVPAVRRLDDLKL
jgi:hypothetical protein